MTGFLLDTNVPSELVRPQPEPKVVAWVAAQIMNDLFISAVSFGELRKGVALRSPGKRRTQLNAWLESDIDGLFSGRTLPLTRSIAELWGVLDAKRERMGRPLQIAGRPDRGDCSRTWPHRCHPQCQRLLQPWPHHPQSLGNRMSALVSVASSSELLPALPPLIAGAGNQAAWRFLEFFTVNIRNSNTSAASRFLTWCDQRGISGLADIKPVHVAGYTEQLQAERPAPTVKQHLGCLRMLFGWLVVGQIIPSNFAHAVKGPRGIES